MVKTMVEDEYLHDGAHDIYLERCADGFRYEETPGARAVRRDAEAVVEVLVQRNNTVAVEYRHQHEGDDHLSDGEAYGHLHIGEGVGGDRSGHRDEGYARHGGADHGQRGHVPCGAAVAYEESRIVGMAPRKIGQGEKYGQVGEKRQ